MNEMKSITDNWQMFVGTESADDIWHIVDPDAKSGVSESLCRKSETASFPVRFRALATHPICPLCLHLALQNDVGDELADRKKENKKMQDVAKISEGISQNHLQYLIPICEHFGYGATMSEAAKAWQKKDPVGAFVVGPCKIMTVPCGCKSPYKCDWCCGSGWLTKHVKAVKDAQK